MNNINYQLSIINYQLSIVILAAGDFPTRGELISLLADADVVVCCDSAYKELLVHMEQVSGPCLQPQAGAPAYQDSGSTSYILHHTSNICFVVGDGDSLPDVLKQQLGDRWIHVSEQNYNDLHKAVTWLASNYQLSTINCRLSILGATGRREDHTLGNIGYLVTFAEDYPGLDIEMLTDYGRFTAFRGSRSYESFPGQQVSLFSMDPDKPLYSKGLKWPLDGLVARRWWQATLNEALANSFELRSEGWTVVFQNW